MAKNLDLCRTEGEETRDGRGKGIEGRQEDRNRTLQGLIWKDLAVAYKDVLQEEIGAHGGTNVPLKFQGLTMTMEMGWDIPSVGVDARPEAKDPL